jgi:carbonic anhydrase/acetyltransferase-like protein (isoleucine patch superfamily)
MSEQQDPKQFGTPSVHKSVFVAQGTSIIGDVQIGERASIWFNCVLRGDVQRIVIGPRTNIQAASCTAPPTACRPSWAVR